MSVYDDEIDRAINLLPVRSTFRGDGAAISVAFLLRAADWRPLKAPWWSGKEVCIIGADYEGNFFLRHCDGSIRFWEHRAQADTLLAPSVREFVARIVE